MKIIIHIKQVVFGIIVIIFLPFIGCTSKTFPDEKFSINDTITRLLNNFKAKDTFFFQNGKNDREFFVITQIDTILSNTKGYFINSRSQKSISVYYKQILSNTLPQLQSEKQYTSKTASNAIEDAKLIEVTKYPDDQTLFINFSFKKFSGLSKGDLGNLFTDTIRVNDHYFTKYYKIKNSFAYLLKDSTEVKAIYLKLDKGIVAFEQLNNEWWILGNK